MRFLFFLFFFKFKIKKLYAKVHIALRHYCITALNYIYGVELHYGITALRHLRFTVFITANTARAVNRNYNYAGNYSRPALRLGINGLGNYARCRSFIRKIESFDF